MSRSMTADAMKKRKEREEKRAAAARLKAMAEGEVGNEEATLFTPPTADESPGLPSSSTDSDAKVLQQQHTVTVQGSSPASLGWYSSEGCRYSSITEAREAGIWSYPDNLHERAKCGVFRDLWDKGNFMGGGIRFGGDFLVYPGASSFLRYGPIEEYSSLFSGDPLRYHSHFVASVIDSPLSTIHPMEVVAHGRLGTATKKSHLLCGWDDEKREVSYYSIEWAGFG